MERRHDSMLSSAAAKKQDDHKLKSVTATMTGQLMMLQNSAKRRSSHSRSHTHSPSRTSTNIPQNSGKKRISHSRSHTHSPSHISTDIPMITGQLTVLQNSGEKRSSHSRSYTHSPSHISTDIAMMNGRVTMLQNSGERRSSHSRSQTYSPSHISTDIPMFTGQVTMLENSGEKRSSHSRSQTHSPSQISTDIPMMNGQLTTLQNNVEKEESCTKRHVELGSRSASKQDHYRMKPSFTTLSERFGTLQNSAEKKNSCSGSFTHSPSQIHTHRNSMDFHLGNVTTPHQNFTNYQSPGETEIQLGSRSASKQDHCQMTSSFATLSERFAALQNSAEKINSSSGSLTHSPSQISTHRNSMEYHLGNVTTPHQNFTNYQSPRKQDIQPCFEDYQLIGDSILLRFSEQLLFYRCKTDEYNGARALGLCVSGQTVGELWRRIVSEMYPISKKVILLIGTNDMLRDTEMDLMKRKLKTVVKELMSQTQKIVVLTLPPVPRLSHRPEHWQRLNEYNAYIKRREKYKNVKVADITSLFLIGPERCRTDCYELFYAGTNRPDRVHLNRIGLQKIYSFLLEKQLLTD